MSRQHENTITTKLVDILNRMRSTWTLADEERLAARSAKVRAQNKRRPSLRRKRDPEAKTLTAEELQQLSLEEGINPEDNLLSSAIIEERRK